MWKVQFRVKEQPTSDWIDLLETLQSAERGEHRDVRKYPAKERAQSSFNAADSIFEFRAVELDTPSPSRPE
jgi:hypothetical protein